MLHVNDIVLPAYNTKVKIVKVDDINIVYDNTYYTTVFIFYKTRLLCRINHNKPISKYSIFTNRLHGRRDFVNIQNRKLTKLHAINIVINCLNEDVDILKTRNFLIEDIFYESLLQYL